MEEKESLSCHCKNYHNYLWIDRTKTTQLTAIMLVAAVGLFIGGFFLGKRKALDAVTEDFKQQAFADELHHSMLMLYGKMPETPADSLDQQPQTPLTAELDQQVEQTSKTQFYAQVGRPYYVLETAQRFVARLQKQGIQSTIIKRESTQKGTQKKVPWYQIVTSSYDNEDQVNNVVNSIKRIDPKTKVTVLKK